MANFLIWLSITFGLFIPTLSGSSLASETRNCAKAIVEAIGKLSHETLMPGDAVRLASPSGKSWLHEGYFVGRLRDQWQDSLVFLDAQDNVLHRIPTHEVAQTDGAAVKLSNDSRIIRIPTQIGPTCAAHALTNCVRQLSAIRGQSGLPRESLYQAAYDLVSSHQVQGGLEQDLGVEKFLRKRKLPFLWLTLDEPTAREELFSHLADGKPVYVSYSSAMRVNENPGLIEHRIDPGGGENISNHGPMATYKPSIGRGEAHGVAIVRTIPTRNGSRKLIVLDSQHGGDLVVWEESELAKFPASNPISAVLIDSSRAGENELLDPSRLKRDVELTARHPEKQPMASLFETLGRDSVRITPQELQELGRRAPLKNQFAVIKLHPGSHNISDRFWAGRISDWNQKELTLKVPGLPDETFDWREIQSAFLPRFVMDRMASAPKP